MNYDVIKNLLLESDNVMITSHKNLDFDAFGSMLGMYYITKLFDKSSYLIIDDNSLSHCLKKALKFIKKTDDINISTYNDVKDLINNKTLLIVLDTNTTSLVQNKNLLEINNILLFDHHIKNNQIKSTYSYIDEKASSTIEIVLDLIEKLNAYISSSTAVIMLSGIYEDTFGFIKNTTDKTHYYTSLLYKFGIDLKEALEFTKQDFNDYKRRKKLVINAEINNGLAISCSNKKYKPYELAMVSNELLVIDSVKASFTIAKVSDTLVGISARSMGDVNVDKIMSLFGGGGHTNEAAAQVKGDVNDIKNKIIKCWGDLNESNIS